MRAQGQNGKERDKHNKCKSLGAKNFTYKYKKFQKTFPGKKNWHTFAVKGAHTPRRPKTYPTPFGRTPPQDHRAHARPAMPMAT